jgi:hypothetical protein
MSKPLTGLRDSVPVAAFAGVVARGTSFSFRLGVTAGFGVKRASVTLEKRKAVKRLYLERFLITYRASG